MIGDISKWTGSIVVATMIVTLLEMLLPNNNIKKYIKTIMGVYILFTIISPIVKAVSNNEINIEKILSEQETASMSNSINMQTSSSIENIYANNIKKDISAKLEQKGYEVLEVKIDFEKNDTEDYGKIYAINIVIRKRVTAKQSKIPKIEISIGDTGLKKELSGYETITETEKKKLKDYLSQTYDVNIEKILIKEGDE